MRTKFGMATMAALALTACGGSDEQVFVGPDGEEVSVERGGDGTTVYRSEDGEAVVTTGEGNTTMPGGLPAYPGADSSRGVNINAAGRDGGSGQISSFQTSDSPADVIAFYRAALERGGYRIAGTMDMGQSQMIIAERAGGDGGVQITATNAGGQETTVSVISGVEG